MNCKNNIFAQCAPETRIVLWNFIDWNKIKQRVKSLQQRIAKAIQKQAYGKAKALQWLLTHSFSAKALAVKRVTENKGKYTSGIDKKAWINSYTKTEAIRSLMRKGYKALPLKRCYIPKKNGKKRALGIPTMRDRAMQALYLLALDPVSESLADKVSYGFRPYRGCADAIARCFSLLARKDSPCWILDADIKGCFDNINHQWLMENIPLDKSVLHQWLKSGFIDNKRLFPTFQGTPQGGIISPTLSNMTLDGLQQTIDHALGIKTWNNGKRVNNIYDVHLVRYADDFIVTSSNPEVIANVIVPAVSKFLKTRGLELSADKTKVVNIKQGFDFLGQNIRKYNGKLLIIPSYDSIKSIKCKIKQVIDNNKTAKTVNLIRTLNPIIRGWANYHRHIVSKDVFGKLDHYIFLLLWRWSVRRHPMKNKHWIKNKYFKCIGLRNWVFCAYIDTKKQIELVKASGIKIVRHIKVKSDANPYLSNWDNYFFKRKKDGLAGQFKQKSVLVSA